MPIPAYRYILESTRYNTVPATFSANTYPYGHRRVNLLINPTFEDSGTTGPYLGWSLRGNVDYFSNNGVLTVAYGPAVSNMILINSAATPVTPGKMYTVSATIKNVGPVSEQVYIRFFPGTEASDKQSVPITLEPGEEQRTYISTINPVESATTAQFYAYCPTYTKGVTKLELSQPILEEGITDGSWFDNYHPSFIDDFSTALNEDGTSVLMLNNEIIAKNWLTNPSFEDGITPTNKYYSSPGTPTISTTDAYEGTQSLLFTATTSGTNVYFAQMAVVPVGTNYVRCSVAVKWVSGSRYAKLRIGYRDTVGTVPFTYNPVDAGTLLKDGWNILTLEGSIADTSQQVSFLIYGIDSTSAMTTSGYSFLLDNYTISTDIHEPAPGSIIPTYTYDPAADTISQYVEATYGTDIYNVQVQTTNDNVAFISYEDLEGIQYHDSFIVDDIIVTDMSQIPTTNPYEYSYDTPSTPTQKHYNPEYRVVEDMNLTPPPEPELDNSNDPIYVPPVDDTTPDELIGDGSLDTNTDTVVAPPEPEFAEYFNLEQYDGTERVEPFTPDVPVNVDPDSSFNPATQSWPVTDTASEDYFPLAPVDGSVPIYMEDNWYYNWDTSRTTSVYNGSTVTLTAPVTITNNLRIPAAPSLYARVGLIFNVDTTKPYTNKSTPLKIMAQGYSSADALITTKNIFINDVPGSLSPDEYYNIPYSLQTTSNPDSEFLLATKTEASNTAVPGYFAAFDTNVSNVSYWRIQIAALYGPTTLSGFTVFTEYGTM